MTFAGLEYEYKSQDLSTLDQDSPHGKLPYIVDTDGTKVGDSNQIIAYLKNKYGDPLDADLTGLDRANALAWNRLLEEHLYWSGVIEPRWRHDSGWETYIPYIVGGAEVTPEMRVGLDAFRERILAGFNGQGMGRRTWRRSSTFSRPTSTRSRSGSATTSTSSATRSTRSTPRCTPRTATSPTAGTRN